MWSALFFYNDKLLFSFYIDSQSIKFRKSKLRSWNELCTFTKDYLEHEVMINLKVICLGVLAEEKKTCGSIRFWHSVTKEIVGKILERKAMLSQHYQYFYCDFHRFYI